MYVDAPLLHPKVQLMHRLFVLRMTNITALYAQHKNPAKRAQTLRVLTRHYLHPKMQLIHRLLVLRVGNIIHSSICATRESCDPSAACQHLVQALPGRGIPGA